MIIKINLATVFLGAVKLVLVVGFCAGTLSYFVILAGFMVDYSLERQAIGALTDFSLASVVCFTFMVFAEALEKEIFGYHLWSEMSTYLALALLSQIAFLFALLIVGHAILSGIGLFPRAPLIILLLLGMFLTFMGMAAWLNPGKTSSRR